MFKKKMLSVLFTTVAVLGLLSANVYAADGNWGLGFPTPGGTPVGNESADYLKKYDAYYIGDTNEKVIYLTFDAGYENGNTEPILDALKKHNVPATFFLVGSYIKSNPELVKRMVADGHIVGNHTMTHPDMSKISDSESFKKEMSLTEDAYKSVIGTDMPKFYRPPRGKYSEANLKEAQKLGYKSIFWSLAYMDFDDKNQPSKEQAFSKLLPRIHPGAIVLLHNTSKTNGQITDELITRYKEMGYTFKNLDTLK